MKIAMKVKQILEKILHVAMYFFIIRFILPYLYVLYAIIKLKTFYIFETDPKQLFSTFLLDAIGYVYIYYSLLMLLYLIIIQCFRMIVFKIKLKEIKGRIPFIIGIVLIFVLTPYISWLFD